MATAVALLVPRLIGAEKEARGVYSFIVAYGNVGLIGFPVLSAVLGGDAVLYAAIANIPWNLFVFSVGMVLISGMPEEGRARSSAAAPSSSSRRCSSRA